MQCWRNNDFLLGLLLLLTVQRKGYNATTETISKGIALLGTLSEKLVYIR